MKIRQGFVSNSSSSSFIVAFPKDMEVTKEAIKDYVFGDKKYIHYYDYSIDTDTAAERILEQMKDQKPSDLKNITDNCHGWVEGYPELDNFRTMDNHKIDWVAYSRATDEHRAKFVAQLITNLEGKDVYAFEFSDNEGDAALEHGGTFDRVPHERISNH